MNRHIIGLVGSLRSGSYNRALMDAFIAQAKEGMHIETARIDTLPFYNDDILDPYPPEAQTLKDTFEQADGFIIATPEYNRGTTGVLKNAIDWVSRPKGSPFAHKPVLVIGASDGNIGTAVAQSGLKTTLLHLNARVLGRPEFFLGMAQEKFDAQGNLTDEKTKAFIDAALETLEKSIT